MGELYVKASGDLLIMEKFLKGENVSLWNYLEDSALEKQEDSEEYQFLLQMKGKDEVEKRKKFLISVGEEE
ncbi:MAG: hypothetical protein IPK55_12450 [Streptococcus sp.]|nr:hypothetical protein [Streptococcus sp.]